MEELQTWRAMLGRVIADPQERQRIADILNVNQITLSRWSSGKSNPRLDSLNTLIDALPYPRQQFVSAVQQEYTHFLRVEDASDTAQYEIPSVFYDRVFKAHATSLPMLRTPSICLLVLQQMIEHLDPYHTGIVAILAQCVQPAADQKVRSLRITLGRGTPPWITHIENHAMFLGVEAQSGQTVMRGHPIVIQHQEEKERMFPSHHTSAEYSVVTYPILRSDRTIGCLYVASTKEEYFSLARLNLIQSYAELLVLAFNDDDFYPLDEIELGIMPPRAKQLPILANFQHLINEHLTTALRNGQVLTRTQVELVVWRQLEEELLRLAFQ